LQEQSDKVVLLDEIDHFLLDRESSEYRRQTGIFQFMTPGMLTKINDLRAAEKVVFVVATNYEERIDAAIKRPGRIDHKLLLLPPNLAQRNRILLGLFQERGRFGRRRADRAIQQALAEVARKTALFTYKELEALVKKVSESSFTNVSQFRQSCTTERESIKPTITLRGYTQRFYEHAGSDSEDEEQDKRLEKIPSVEYLVLLYLWLESFFGSGKGKTLTKMGIRPDERDVQGIVSVLKAVDPTLTLMSEKDQTEQVLMEHINDNHIVDCLARWLPQLQGGFTQQ
jgi:SpoVK/Ycf46/Vps4 family AAA+-type ATPase